jgi:hypothetical protein
MDSSYDSSDNLHKPPIHIGFHLACVEYGRGGLSLAQPAVTLEGLWLCQIGRSGWLWDLYLR